MPINETLIKELQQEAETTRKILARVPLNNPDWKPHEKSAAIGFLSTHVAELPTWINATLDHDELDFSKFEYKQTVVKNAEELVALHDKSVKNAIECLKKYDDAHFMTNWTLRNGDAVYFTAPKVDVVRSTVLNHIIHHRAQLGVYLRLLDVPLPGSYGPTADEPMM